MHKVDLNSDLGEGFGAYELGMDHEILRHVSSANVACGFHAGDPVVMARTVRAAREAGVAVGAHPGFPDLMGFGRRAMALSFDEAKAAVQYQVGALMAFTRSAGIPLQHVKAHGALYNMAAVDKTLARAIAEAVAEVDDRIILLCLAGSEMLAAGRACGLRVASEVFADRAYADDGTLVPRPEPGAVIHDQETAIERALGMVTRGTVQSITGKEIAISADSICVHGDNPQAIAFVQAIRGALAAHGVTLANLADIV